MVQNKIYKCDICGNIVELLYEGGGQLVCCGQPMQLIKEKLEEEGHEKHLPVVEKTDSGIKVKVGSVPHPMDDNHYIQWIEITTADDKSQKKFLKPTDNPEAEFGINVENVKAVREYCNLHGLWKS